MLSAAACYYIMATAIPIVPASAAHLKAFMSPHPPKHVATNTKHPPAQPPPHNNLAKFWILFSNLCCQICVVKSVLSYMYAHTHIYILQTHTVARTIYITSAHKEGHSVNRGKLESML